MAWHTGQTCKEYDIEIKKALAEAKRQEALEEPEEVNRKGGRPEQEIVNLRSGSLGVVHLNDEVYGSNCGRCPVFIHELLYSP
jgi:hypothetical protein